MYFKQKSPVLIYFRHPVHKVPIAAPTVAIREQEGCFPEAKW